MLKNIQYWRRGTSLHVAGTPHDADDLRFHIHPIQLRTYGCDNCEAGTICSGCKLAFPTGELIPFEEAHERGLHIVHIVFDINAPGIDEPLVDALVELDDRIRLARLAARMREGTDHPLVLAAAA